MPNSNVEIHSEYSKGATETTSRSVEELKKDDIKITPERYGSGKPKRVIIRAKITHDTN